MNDSVVRVGVVGTTWYAETHLRALQSHPSARLVALAGRDQEKAREVADRYGIPQVFADYRAMIQSGELDAIAIIAPDDLHLPITIEALEAGVHVLCEKPLASTAADAERMYRAAAASGLKHMSFFALRNSVHHRYLKALLDEGYVGRVYAAHFELTHGFFRQPGYQWRFDAGRGTGALGDLGCYLVDQARWYVGDISAVAADLAHFVNRPSSDGGDYLPANDSAVLAIRFGNGAHGTMSTRVVAHEADRMQQNTVILQGEAGTLELQHTFAGATLRGARAIDSEFRELEIPSSFWAGVDPAQPQLANTVHSVGDRAFIDAIIQDGTAVPSFFDGWQVQRVLETAFASAEAQAWRSLDQEVSP
ncbi:Gfo/Idh/MocA family protein [Naasia aerilata]|uniref:Oxidoreductase n=1 Tax=Naasia aerilata TaxID=1162966 RepID=A0ABN6XMJ0_9MICO|nr:Gfo/Idh/MocA family oxidoreductase [Naasia aerilata]BDZ46169.1 oxidoreductase [Naasia aerilata]